MIRTVFVVSVLLAFPFVLLAQEKPSAAPAPPPSAASAAPSAAPPALLAEDVYKNVQIFKGKPATRLLPAMIALRGLLGVECDACHTPKDWDKDDKPPKAKARTMFDMIAFINDTPFQGQNKVSCWTCHHGNLDPAKLAPDPEAVKRTALLIHIPPEDEEKNASEVFRNIQVMKEVPAGRLPFVMTFFSRSLGVECSYCHVEGQWEKDDKEPKRTARTMLTDVVHPVLQKYYAGNGPVGCFTCHQGQPHPELTAGEPAPAPKS
jgi:hypothetical protein